MTPDLGDYAFTVLAAYGVSLGLIGALVALSVRRAARVRRDLARVEQGASGGGDGV